MKAQTPVLFALVVITLVVGVDFLFLRHQEIWKRLLANVGIVAVVAVVYLAIFRRGRAT